MNAVRYYSKSGNTKKIAKAIAEGIGVNAISITDEPALNIDPEMVKKVVLFTTSNWSHRTVHGLKKILENKGITVEKDHFYAQMLMVNSKVNAAKEFGKRFVKDKEDRVHDF